MAKKRKPSSTPLVTAASVLKRHFGKTDPAKLVTASREYPIPAKADVHRALEEVMPGFKAAVQHGLHVEYMHETLTLGHLLGNLHTPVLIGPLQYEEVDTGEVLPVHCARRALWLAREGTMPFAVITGGASRFGQDSGTGLEIAVPPGVQGGTVARGLFDAVDARVKRASSYRGRVISLGRADQYSGRMGSIRVHNLARVAEDQLVLPAATVELLNRNAIGFVEQRERLKALGLPGKKGLLFYGPPGTGKTHTIHYLASRLPGHTTLLVTAEEVGLLEHYFQLARFLQPAMLVIEDADLIARSRENMNGPCEEALLNKLLNEMDGLREDAEILFVLTTNRPEQIESALASRPGRIDQAIEFPLPDEAGRRRLARLYARGLELEKQVEDDVVKRTEGASASLIKELMRRSAQFLLESGEPRLTVRHAAAAFEEMLFQGGSLNVKLLGGLGAMGGRAS